MDSESETRFDGLLLSIAQQHSGIDDVSYTFSREGTCKAYYDVVVCVCCYGRPELW